MDTPPDEPEITTERPATSRREATIEEHMDRLAEGEDSALGPLFDAVAPVVRRYLERRMPAERVDASLQKVMLGLYGGRSTFLKDANVLTWAFSFAQYIVKDEGTGMSDMDADVIELVLAGLHAKDIATILDISTTKVRASMEQLHQQFATRLDAERAKVPAVPGIRATSPSAGELVGNVIGPYRVEELIGSGGFGNVYRASRIGGGTEVAIKVMRDIPDTDRRAVERFKREARVMVEIGGHPNIVDIVGEGDLPDGRAWYAMTLLRGDPLDTIVGRGTPMPWPRVARLVRQLCGALGKVHGADIVHGDVKPANCFLTGPELESEALRLLDFGLAKREAQRANGTSAPVDGTAQYVAPELLQGRAPDRRADVYAVGVMMFEMLAGRPPFDAESHARLIVEKTIKPQPTLEARCGLRFPRGVEALVRRAMHQDPAQRFESVEALAAAIVALGPEGRRTAPWRSIGRDARVRMAMIASISALTASLATAAILYRSEGRLPWVPRLEPDHITPVIDAARPRLDACRDDAELPRTATIRVLGETGRIIEIPTPASDCVRDVLFSLRFNRFDDVAQRDIEVEL